MLKQSLMASILAVTSFLVTGISSQAATPVQQSQVKDYWNHPNREAIEYVVKNRLMWMFPDGNFRPNQPITQADLVVGLVAVKGLTQGESVNEVPATHWAKAAYEKAKKDGILENIEINPNKVLNREEAGQLMVNAWKNFYSVYRNKRNTYSDVAVRSEWLSPKAGKFINGIETSEYDALSNVIRSELAKTLTVLHKDYIGIGIGEDIANRFHSSLRVVGTNLQGTIPKIAGYQTRLLVGVNNGPNKEVTSGKFSLDISQIRFLQFSVKRTGEAYTLALYNYTDMITLDRVSAR